MLAALVPAGDRGAWRSVVGSIILAVLMPIYDLTTPSGVGTTGPAGCNPHNQRATSRRTIMRTAHDPFAVAAAARLQPDRDHHRGRADRRHDGHRRQPACSAAATAAKYKLAQDAGADAGRQDRAVPDRTPARCPTSLEELVTAPGDANGWLGPYAKEAELKDPWGHADRVPQARRDDELRPDQPRQGRQARRHERRRATSSTSKP